FLDFVDLPRHTSQPLELALYLLDRDPEGERRLKQAEKDAADRAHLESHGWRVRDSREVAGSPETYRAYVPQSRGEFSCAKPSGRPIPWRTPTAGVISGSTSTGPWRSRRSAAE